MSEVQSIFLRKMDGLEVNEGVVYVITTNCPPELIAPEFKRPGRIDLVLPFKPPTPELRRQLIDRWHADIRSGIDIERAVSDTDRFSFAEMEEVKNLLILRQQDTARWEWDWALQQFHENRQALAKREPIIGFAALLNRQKSS